MADLGPQSLKNIAEPVRAYLLRHGVPVTQKSPRAASRRRWPALAAALALALLAAGSFAWRLGYAPRFMAASVEDKLATATKLSIIVLPFENLSSDKEHDYFADAITDDLTADLSHLQDSFVISRGTAFTYKGRPVDAKRIGRELACAMCSKAACAALARQSRSTRSSSRPRPGRMWGLTGSTASVTSSAGCRSKSSHGSPIRFGVELVKAEALRATRERPTSPDAADLAMQASVQWHLPDSKANLNDAVTLSERALALDPQNVRALTVLANALIDRVVDQWSDDPAGDIARADKASDAALGLQPDDSWAHSSKAWVLFAKRQWEPAVAQAEAAIALDRNNARNHAFASFWKMFLGEGEDGFAGVETALRLSPRDPQLPWWQLYMCAFHAQLAQWEEAIAWCSKAVAGLPQAWYPLVGLAAANAWAGRDKEAKEAAAQLQKVYPGFTVQAWAGIHWTDDPTFNAQNHDYRRGRCVAYAGTSCQARQ